MIIDKILYWNRDFIQSFGYLLIFLATFLESSPFVGVFVPGAVAIFLAGFLAKLGFMNLWFVFILAIAGAIFGDLGGYLFGRYCGKEFLHKYGKYFLIRKEYIEKAGDVVNGHTGKSLVIGRLNPITRAAAPFIVGAHKVNFNKFMFFNVVGGILWGFLFVSLGYLFGESYQFAIKFEKWLILGTLLLMGGFYAYYFIGLLFKKINGKNKCELKEHGFDCKK